MAGSYNHVTNRADGSYAGMSGIENLGDAEEAIEEMWFMLDWLATINRASRDALLKRASDEYYACLRGEKPWPTSMAAVSK